MQVINVNGVKAYTAELYAHTRAEYELAAVLGEVALLSYELRGLERSRLVVRGVELAHVRSYAGAVCMPVCS